MAVLLMTWHIVSKICYRKTFISKGSCTQGPELAPCRGAKIASWVAGALSVIYLLSWSRGVFKLVS